MHAARAQLSTSPVRFTDVIVRDESQPNILTVVLLAESMFYMQAGLAEPSSAGLQAEGTNGHSRNAMNHKLFHHTYRAHMRCHIYTLSDPVYTLPPHLHHVLVLSSLPPHRDHQYK